MFLIFWNIDRCMILACLSREDACCKLGINNANSYLNQAHPSSEPCKIKLKSSILQTCFAKGKFQLKNPCLMFLHCHFLKNLYGNVTVLENFYEFRLFLYTNGLCFSGCHMWQLGPKSFIPMPNLDFVNNFLCGPSKH